MSSEPTVNNLFAQYCTYIFKPASGVRYYWDRAVTLARMHGFSWFENVGSIQVKYFYVGNALNPNTGTYQQATLIWQFECNKYACWITTGRADLPETPDISSYYGYLYVDSYNLMPDGCCKCGDSGSCIYCVWANRHCGGCFAPDESASQNFAHEFKGRRTIWP